ncbi:MAG: hypothetical protein JOZ64_12720 [Solirubrobacterales bacterium]|nr:hypothetical protein [Solirubrobacterales bacterium]
MGARRAATMVLALAFLIAGAPAAAADETLQASGSMVYAWHGDRARGCAAAGVCGVHGALVIQPLGATDLNRLGRSSGDLLFGAASATARVTSGDSGPCVDQAPEGGGLGLGWTAGGAVSANLDVAPSSGRCAGPLAHDLGRVPIRGRRFGGERASFDLRGSVAFTAGPYAGTLVSTLVFRPSVSPFTGSFSSSGGSSSSGPGRTRALTEYLDLRYRVTVLASAVVIPFTGEMGPFCAALATCGASGTLAISLPGRPATIGVSASRAVATRVGRGQAIRDFLAGKLPVPARPPVNLPRGLVDETFTGPGLAACTDSVPVTGVALGFGAIGPPRGTALPVALVIEGSGDPLRTHCPGPAFADVFGQNQTFAAVGVPRRQLLRASWLVKLAPSGVFSGPGYVGTRGGAVRVELSLLRVTAGTRLEAPS